MSATMGVGGDGVDCGEERSRSRSRTATMGVDCGEERRGDV